MDKIYFNFFDIPDLIIKMKYSRKDYDMIIKILQKVKKSYLESKLEKENYEKMQEQFQKGQGRINKDIDADLNDANFGSFKGKKLESDHNAIDNMQVTDEDFVPLDLFDGVLAEYQHKY